MLGCGVGFEQYYQSCIADIKVCFEMVFFSTCKWCVTMLALIGCNYPWLALIGPSHPIANQICANILASNNNNMSKSFSDILPIFIPCLHFFLWNSALYQLIIIQMNWKFGIYMVTSNDILNFPHLYSDICMNWWIVLHQLIFLFNLRWPRDQNLPKRLSWAL